MQEKESISTEDWKIRQDNRSRNRMKFVIKLGAEQAQAYRNFQDVMMPDGTDEEEFNRQVMLYGMMYMQEKLKERFLEFAEENREDLEASGITVIDNGDGGFTVSSAEDQPVSASSLE